jgi:hypothetical protein
VRRKSIEQCEATVKEKQMAVDAVSKELRDGWSKPYHAIEALKNRAIRAFLDLRNAEKALQKARERTYEEPHERSANQSERSSTGRRP